MQVHATKGSSSTAVAVPLQGEDFGQVIKGVIAIIETDFNGLQVGSCPGCWCPLTIDCKEKQKAGSGPLGAPFPWVEKHTNIMQVDALYILNTLSGGFILTTA